VPHHCLWKRDDKRTQLIKINPHGKKGKNGAWCTEKGDRTGKKKKAKARLRKEENVNEQKRDRRSFEKKGRERTKRSTFPHKKRHRPKKREKKRSQRRENLIYLKEGGKKKAKQNCSIRSGRGINRRGRRTSADKVATKREQAPTPGRDRAEPRGKNKPVEKGENPRT